MSILLEIEVRFDGNELVLVSESSIEGFAYSRIDALLLCSGCSSTDPGGYRKTHHYSFSELPISTIS